MTGQEIVQVSTTDAMNYGQQILLMGLSETSKRQYEHTFNRWIAYCDETNKPHNALSIINVNEFLHHDKVSFETRKARLSHIRNLIKAMYASNPDNIAIKRLYKELNLLKLTRTKGEKDSTQTKHALTQDQIDDTFKVFAGNSNKDVRNRCILAVLFYAGLRRSEVASLKWTDFDFENELVTVRHGKGDKQRTIPIMDGWEHIKAWHSITGHRTFAFCGLKKNDKLSKDKHVSTQTIYRVIQEVSDVLGIESLSPHDARRTIFTELLNNGASVRDVQYLAGHSDSSTTLKYAQIRDAKEVAGRLRGAIKKPS